VTSLAKRVSCANMQTKNSICVALIACVLLTLAACTTVPVNNQKATRSSAQRQAALEAQFNQGKTLFLQKQYAAAAKILLPIARQGHVGAQYTIGYMYHYGYGLPHNEKESTRWIAIAAARGHPQAKEAMARINAMHDKQGVASEPATTPGISIIKEP
jgi:TPR repeat protein